MIEIINEGDKKTAKLKGTIFNIASITSKTLELHDNRFIESLNVKYGLDFRVYNSIQFDDENQALQAFNNVCEEYQSLKVITWYLGNNRHNKHIIQTIDYSVQQAFDKLTRYERNEITNHCIKVIQL